MKKLKKGSKGREVKLLQTALNKAPLKAGLKIDGIFGDKTEASVRAYQKRNRLKIDGIAGDDTQTALGLVKSSPRSGSNGSGWPYKDVADTIKDVVARHKATRTLADKHLAIAAKTKTGDMRRLEADMLAAMKVFNVKYRDNYAVLQMLEKLKGEYIKARRDKPSSVPDIRRKANGWYKKAAQTLLRFMDAQSEVENKAREIQEAKSAAAKIKPIAGLDKKYIRDITFIRDFRQKQTLDNMKYCAKFDTEDYKEVRMKYIRLEVEAEKAHKFWLSHAEILMNLQEMHNKAIPTSTSKELGKLRDRYNSQLLKVVKLMKASYKFNDKARAIDKELAALRKLQAA